MKFFSVCCAILWLIIAVAGGTYLAAYENVPGQTNVVYPTAFPHESRLATVDGRATLLFFAHPKCPCSRASVRELARLMADTGGKLQAYVVFIKPTDVDEEWTVTDLRASAEAIPNVTVVIDEGERETNLFNAQTSGTALLYDQSGKLRFDGGITAARGHEGDNAGSRAIFEIVTADAANSAETLVFGCPLHKKGCDGELMPSVP